MGFWIVVGDFNTKVDLPNELADRFYARIRKKYVKDKSGSDSFTITHDGVELLVVIRRENEDIDGILALEKDGGLTFNGDVVEVKLPWREDPEWGDWDTKTNFWDKINEVGGFFRKYRYATIIKIYPETVVPDNCDESDDFFERGYRNSGTKLPGIFNELVGIAKAILDRHPDGGTPVTKSGAQPNAAVAATSTTASPKKSRRNNPKRVKDENAAIKEFWLRTLDGEIVTQEEIAVKHKFGKQALSKKHYNKKTGESTDSRRRLPPNFLPTS